MSVSSVQRYDSEAIELTYKSDSASHPPAGGWNSGYPFVSLEKSRSMPSIAPEYLPPVPFQMSRFWLPVRTLRVADRLSVVGHQRLLEPGGTVRLIGDEQDALRDREGP